MTATFLVELNVPDTDLVGYAQDIQDDLQSMGHEVLSVKPWARPSLSFGAATPPTPPDVSGIQNQNQ